MQRGQPLGLDELMIVNPGEPCPGPYFMGEPSAIWGWSRYFLGEDGTLYQVRGLGLGEAESGELARFFLGEDGRLYEVVK